MAYRDEWGIVSMKIFISWSGNKSQEVAKILKQWIPCVIQSVEPYFSSADIDKGARWSTDIAKELQDASFGILCVTRDNLSSSWLNFEAGALSKSIEQSRVCPFLVDLKPTDITNSPILQFQMASATREDVYRLFKSINDNLGETKLTEDVLSTTFETFWPKIDEALKGVATVNDAPSTTKKSSKDNQASIEEILELVRYQHKLLKSPEELLPVGYLADAFMQLSTRTVSGDLLMEIFEQLQNIKRLTVSAIEKCEYPVGENKIPVCVSQLIEIQESTEQITRLLKRNMRNTTRMY